MIIEFEPLDHKYDDGKGISVSTLIGEYKNKFDKPYWLRYKAWEHVLFPDLDREAKKAEFRIIRKQLGYTFDMMQERSDMLFIKLMEKYPKLGDIVEDDIRATIEEEWRVKNEKSLIEGTEYHDTNEKESIRRGVELNPFTKEMYPVIQAYDWVENIKIQKLDLTNLPKGYYPELMLKYHSIYGQTDRCWIGDNKEVYIRDFKTNKKLDFENPFQKMLKPLVHLDDCEFNHYALQLSLYAYIMEQYGYTVIDLALDHYDREIRVPYLKKEVEQIVYTRLLNEII